MSYSTAIVAYLALFSAAGFSFLFINLLLGKLLRPKAPNFEKLEVYECGEPTIGSSFVQFDLRFYVVALLFIIFDVEVAFFFPWATVFGKSTQLMDPRLADVEYSMPLQSADALGPPLLTRPEVNLLAELGVNQRTAPKFNASMASDLGIPGDPEQLSKFDQGQIALRHSARNLSRIAMIDMGVFFGILLVGFAYVWRRGDLDWVRAVAREPGSISEAIPPPEREPVLSS